MKLTIERATLLRSLSHVQSVVERRNTIPILSNVLLAAEGNDLSLTATDLDLTIIETVGTDVAQAGATTATAANTIITRRVPNRSIKAPP